MLLCQYLSDVVVDAWIIRVFKGGDVNPTGRTSALVDVYRPQIGCIDDFAANFHPGE